ncbi:MAG: protein phosphatase 2C domain-containing protein [Bacteroidia bacterium]
MKLSIERQAALTETGSRFLNEDRIYPSQTDAVDDIPQVAGLYMVADGSGGADKGNIASKIAIREFARYIHNFPPTNAQITYGYLSAALLRVEEAFHQYIAKQPETEGMGSTIALAYADHNGVAIGWIGNSRVYQLRGNEILFQTRDQMVIQDMVAHGKLSPEEAEAQKNNFTQARMIQGTTQPTDLDFRFIPIEDLEQGDSFFLCTDGVTREISDKEIANLLSGDKDAASVKDALVTLCKNESSDNFSAVFFELGELSEGAKQIDMTSTPPLAASDDLGLDLEDLEEPPVNHAPVTGGATVFDRISEEAEEETEVEATEEVPATLLERIQARAQQTESKINEQGETDEEKGKEEDDSASTAEGRPRPDVSPEPRPGFLQRWGMPLLLAALLIAALGYALSNLGGNEQRKQFEMALNKGEEASRADSIIHYAGLAMDLSANDADRNKAQRLYDKGIESLNLEIQELRDKASMLAAKDGANYSDFYQAEKKLTDASLLLGKYAAAEGLSGVRKEVKSAIDSLQIQIGGISEADKVKHLLSRAESLCKEGKGEEADEFYSHADDLIGTDKKLREQLAVSIKNCNPPVATRSLDPTATEGAESTTPTPADQGAQVADVTTGTTPESTATTSSPKPTTNQLQYLEKGIALFEKQRISNSNYEATKAAEYLEKAGPARTGAASYMLSVLYHNGKGVDKNDKKAMQFARESALQGYPGGHYLYAAMLLDNENAVDSVTAKQSLNIAASKGHPEATNLLYQLMQPAARLRP